MTNKELYDLTKYLFESWERGADYNAYHMDSQYVLDALVMPEEERWLLYTTPPQRKPLTKSQIIKIVNAHTHDDNGHDEIWVDGEAIARATEAAHNITKESK